MCSHLDKLIRSPCSRSIQLTVGSDGTKTPRGEYNNWSLEQVLDNAGSGNTHSIPDPWALHIIDIDTQEPSELKEPLDARGVGYTTGCSGMRLAVLLLVAVLGERGALAGPCDATSRVVSGVVKDVIRDCAGCLALRCASARKASTGNCFVCSAGVPGVTATCSTASIDAYCSAGSPPPPSPEPEECASNAKSCSCSQCDCSHNHAWPCGGGGGGCACAGTRYCSCGGVCHPVTGYPCPSGSGHRRLRSNSSAAMSVGDLLLVSGILGSHAVP